MDCRSPTEAALMPRSGKRSLTCHCHVIMVLKVYRKPNQNIRPSMIADTQTVLTRLTDSEDQAETAALPRPPQQVEEHSPLRMNVYLLTKTSLNCHRGRADSFNLSSRLAPYNL